MAAFELAVDPRRVASRADRAGRREPPLSDRDACARMYANDRTVYAVEVQLQGLSLSNY